MLHKQVIFDFYTVFTLVRLRLHATFLGQWACSHLYFYFSLDIRIKEEEPDPEEWQLSGDSTLNTNDLTHLRVQVVDEEGDQQHQEGKRLRRVACTCPNCKEGGGRYAHMKHYFLFKTANIITLIFEILHAISLNYGILFITWSFCVYI